MITKRPAFYIRSIFILMAALLSLAWASNAHADTAANEAAQMTVAPNGQIMIRGGVIESLSGDTAVVSTTWGKTTLRWTVDLTGSTRYVPAMGSVAAKAALKVGDPVSFTGEIDTLAAEPTVIASVFKDNALYEDSASIGGRVLSVDSKQRHVVIQNDAGTTTISLWGGSFILKGGNKISLGDISVGDTLSASGSLNRITSTLSADRVDIETPKVSSSGNGILASIINWFTGTRGAALSVRDR